MNNEILWHLHHNACAVTRANDFLETAATIGGKDALCPVAWNRTPGASSCDLLA